MSTALRAFMDNLVDYAGLFPPASLDMDTAVREYSLHRGEAEAWMLGRFIVPAGRLAELSQSAADLFTRDLPWRLSVLAGDRQSAANALAELPGQCAQINTFEQQNQGLAAVEVLEVPLPADTPASTQLPFLNSFLDGLVAAKLTGREIFWEIPPSASEEEELPLLENLAQLAEHRAGPGADVLRLGAKLRCGGVAAEAFPPVERIARIIAHCRDLELPLKCTAGLHHPVLHRASEPDVMMHGFLNVFGAGLMAHAYGWDADRLATILADTEPESFVFDARIFRWRDHAVAADQLRRLRSHFLCGFGSCSFDEPRDDLQNLGLL